MLRGVLEKYFERQYNYIQFLLLILSHHAVLYFQHFMKECYHSFHSFLDKHVFSFSLLGYLWANHFFFMTFSPFTIFITRHGWKRYCQNLIKISWSVFIHWLSSWFVLINPFSPVSHFYYPWKRQKTKGFLTISGGIEM